MVLGMEEVPLSTQAIARIKAAKLEAGADLLSGLAEFWRGISMSTKALREHDPLELMPLFERYAEKRWGRGWKMNANGRKRAFDEVNAFGDDGESFRSKVDAELAGFG